SSTPAGKRSARAYGLGKHFVCTKCFKKQGQEQLQQQDQQLLADAMGFEQDHQLPELEGSEKQITWATKIRYEVLTEIMESTETPEQAQQAETAMQAANAITISGWWIDNLRDLEKFSVDDYIELITTADPTPETDRIETENPF